jgi:hypothetical protein
MRRISSCLCAALVLVLAGCGEQAESPNATQVSAGPSAADEASASASASATERPTAGNPPRLRMGELPAGRYSTNAFEPGLLLTLPDGWEQFFPDEQDEIALGGPGVDVNITRPPKVVDPDTRVAADTPESLLEWFTEHPSLDVGEPVEVQIDGIASHYVDVAVPSSEIDIFAYPPGNMRLPAGARSRVYIVPLEGPDLVALILTPSASADFDAALEVAEPIVTSLIISD